MAIQKKPRVITRCPANTYAAASERIVEFSASGARGHVGGLISLRLADSGSLTVEVYRCDDGVHVVPPRRETEAAALKYEAAFPDRVMLVHDTRLSCVGVCYDNSEVLDQSFRGVAMFKVSAPAGSAPTRQDVFEAVTHARQHAESIGEMEARLRRAAFNVAPWSGNVESLK